MSMYRLFAHICVGENSAGSLHLPHPMSFYVGKSHLDLELTVRRGATLEFSKVDYLGPMASDSRSELSHKMELSTYPLVMETCEMVADMFMATALQIQRTAVMHEVTAVL